MTELKQPSCMKTYCELYDDLYQSLSDVSKDEILKKDKKMLSLSSTEIDEYLSKKRNEELEFYHLVDVVLEKNPRGVESFLDEPTVYKQEELSIDTEISEHHPKFYLIMLAARHRHSYYVSDEELHKRECEIVEKVQEYQRLDKGLLSKIEKAAGVKMINSVGGAVNAIAFYKALSSIDRQNG